ncbi:kinase-like domain-containing protein [Ilyonectria destructans]|nr:kinase-like domain-containing protein [Ilyonectria destructans]
MSSSSADTTRTESDILKRLGFIELLDGGNRLISRELWFGKSATGNPTATVTGTDVAGTIRQQLKRAGVSTSRRGKYVPVSKLGDIISQPNISKLIDELRSCRHMSPSEKDQLMNKICFVQDNRCCSTYRRIVAALIKTKCEEHIRSVVEESFSDDCLPISCSIDDYTLRDQRTGKVCKTMQKWNSETREKYWSSIDKYNAPVFMRPSEQGIYHYVLDARMILPFERSPSVYAINRDSINQVGSGGDADDDNEGGFSTVKRVKIHADHHRFGSYGVSPNEGFFAIKSLHSRQRKNFEEEVMVLLRFSHRTDKQLVKLLATYELWDGNAVKYHLIFPWADGTVRTLWKELTPIDRKDLSLLQWMSSQLFAVCDSLAFIHEEYAMNLPLEHRERWGRHGDIKAGNFLVYKDSSQPFSKGSIFIADFGLSRFHRQQSRSQVNPRAASPSYRPPEFDTTDGTLSRKSDIWSLGAFFLEFVTWYLMGYEAVEATFPACRETQDHDGITSDIFFQIQTEGGFKTATVKPEVINWIKRLHQSGGATHYVHDLLDLIQKDMLIVAKDSRIEAIQLKEKLEVMHKRCMTDSNYVTESCKCGKTAN